MLLLFSRPLRSIGMGTFSTVYLAKLMRKEPVGALASPRSGSKHQHRSRSEHKQQQSLPEKVAIKQLVPTSGTDRILMEVECLRRAQGKEVRVACGS